MKRLPLIIFLFSSFISSAQFSDDFSDGNFTANPSWYGDVSQFKVNTSKQLQLSSSGANTSSLYTVDSLASLDNIEWHFWIHLSFSPSANNYGRVYLVSDQSNLKGPLNGYYLQFGEALSNDAVELFRQTDSTSSSVCRGTNGQIANAFAVGVRVTRDATGLWSLFVDPTGGTNYVSEASGTDLTYSSSSWFGVVCSYTSSNSTNFYFDNFYVGAIIVDTTPPTITSVSAIDSVHLDIGFSKAIDQVSAAILENYAVNNSIGNPVTAMRDNSDLSIVHLTFAIPFANNVSNILTVNNVKDYAGNLIAVNSTANFIYYILVDPQPQGIVINEILAQVKTGGVEFVEIYNRSQTAFDLSQLVFTKRDLTTGLIDSSGTITSTRFLFLPGDYLVLTSNPAIVKDQYITLNPNAFLQMHLPTLLDGGDDILLLSPESAIIDEVHYSESWQFPLLNSTAGVSLERLSFNLPSQDSTNWHSAAQTVGFATPGYKNSESDVSSVNGSEISVEPETFSPDDDGHNDVLNIHYSFSVPGYVAKVSVYDARGRLTRTLVNNELLGNAGYFVWDGLTDEKEKARIGMYIIYVEVYNLNGDVKSFKKTCVLAGKL
jgi:hypothetical protein